MASVHSRPFWRGGRRSEALAGAGRTPRQSQGRSAPRRQLDGPAAKDSVSPGPPLGGQAGGEHQRAPQRLERDGRSSATSLERSLFPGASGLRFISNYVVRHGRVSSSGSQNYLPTYAARAQGRAANYLPTQTTPRGGRAGRRGGGCRAVRVAHEGVEGRLVRRSVNASTIARKKARRQRRTEYSVLAADERHT